MTALIGQISDIHAEPGAASLKALQKAIDYLVAAKPNAVIVSGDLSNKPHRRGYALVREALEALPCSVLMVPGNADDREKMREGLGDVGHWPPDGPLHVVGTVAGVRLVGLDVTVPGESFGEVTPGVIDYLQGALGEEPQTPAIVFMHQHPFATHGPLDSRMCRNVEPLQALLDSTETPILALVCGHAHRAITTRFGRTTAMMCPSLVTANPAVVEGYPVPPAPDAPGIVLHAVSGTSLVSHTISLR